MTTAQKNAAISAAILAHVAAGKPLPEAMDAVLGTGTFMREAGALYDALRAKAGK
jgi:hypothetical protein